MQPASRLVGSAGLYFRPARWARCSLRVDPKASVAVAAPRPQRCQWPIRQQPDKYTMAAWIARSGETTACGYAAQLGVGRPSSPRPKVNRRARTHRDILPAAGFLPPNIAPRYTFRIRLYRLPWSL